MCLSSENFRLKLEVGKTDNENKYFYCIIQMLQTQFSQNYLSGFATLNNLQF